MVKAAMVAGHDPILAINAPTELTRTFREAAMSFLEMRADNANLADASQRQQLAHQRTYAFPALGRLQVQSIDAARIANCRSEERRVGKECVSTSRSRWSPKH